MKKAIGNVLWFLIVFIFCEIYLHVNVFENYDVGLPVILCIPVAVFFAFLCALFPRWINLLLGGIITFLTCLFCVVELVYYGIFHTLVAPFSSLGMAGNAVDFQEVLFSYLENNVGQWAVAFIPCAVYIVVCVFKLFGKRIPKEQVKKGCWFSVMLYCIGFFCMLPQGMELKTPLNLYFFGTHIDMNIEKLGVTTGIRLDLERVLCKKLSGYDSLWQQPITNVSVLYRGDEYGDPNIIDYDFDKLIEECGDSKIRSMHEYFKEEDPTYKNSYTGMFEGYNLVFITAEAWWKYAVSEELTPTLYKMLNEGFVFDNYYTPLWVGSTIGGEFANLTGLISKETGQYSLVLSGEQQNDMRFTLSRMLQKEGYDVRAFHSYYYGFYSRSLSHPNMGFDWYAYENGYEAELDENGEFLWPQSDLKLAEDTFDIYGNYENQPFYAYYMSFSGHANYDESNAMSMRHWDKVEDLPYSDTAKAYLACNYELELAVEYLIQQLDEQGLLENTLFVIAPDHVPYGYLDMCSELAGEDLENNLDWYRSSLIIWSASMEEPVEVSKYCSSIDIFPTVANLMGLEYDSRFLAGQDIMSDAEQFVIFPDRSWITGKGIYDSYQDTFTPFDGEEVSETYQEEVSEIVEQKIKMSADIIDYDYYAILPE